MAKGIRRKGEVQSIVKSLAKSGKNYSEINEELKQRFGKSYRKQDLLTDIRNYSKKEKKTTIKETKKPIKERIKEKREKQSKYIPKKYRKPEVTGFRFGRKGEWQKKKYSVVIGYRFIPYGKRKKQETFRTLTYNQLPKTEADILRDAMGVWIDESSDERILLPSSSDQVTGRITQKKDVWIESITELII